MQHCQTTTTRWTSLFSTHNSLPPLTEGKLGLIRHVWLKQTNYPWTTFKKFAHETVLSQEHKKQMDKDILQNTSRQHWNGRWHILVILCLISLSLLKWMAFGTKEGYFEFMRMSFDDSCPYALWGLCKAPYYAGCDGAEQCRLLSDQHADTVQLELSMLPPHREVQPIKAPLGRSQGHVKEVRGDLLQQLLRSRTRSSFLRFFAGLDWILQVCRHTSKASFTAFQLPILHGLYEYILSCFQKV